MRPSVGYSAVLLLCIVVSIGFIVQSSRLELRKRRATEQREFAMFLPIDDLLRNGTIGNVTDEQDSMSSESATSTSTSSSTGTTVREILGKYEPKMFYHRRYGEMRQHHVHPVPLESILDENNTIVGDPSWLLDFGIIGYGKCGTSTMMIWLLEHPEVQAFGKEMSEFMKQQPGDLVQKLYEDLEPGPFKRGYKAPQDITQRHILDYYRRYWPTTKLILGVRHPIWWFESLYNFRVQNLPHKLALPHPNKLVGACVAKRYGACTNKGDYAISMMNLGKHNYPQPREPSKLETGIMSRYRRLQLNFSEVEYMPNPVFLFELNQLGDVNETRNEKFRRDMSSFMGLSELLPAIPHAIPGKKRNEREQVVRDEMKIAICDDEFAPLRAALMELSVTNSLWIRQVFLQSPTVFVSSPEHFNELLMTWMVDPCDEAETSRKKG